MDFSKLLGRGSGQLSIICETFFFIFCLDLPKIGRVKRPAIHTDGTFYFLSNKNMTNSSCRQHDFRRKKCCDSSFPTSPNQLLKPIFVRISVSFETKLPPDSILLAILYLLNWNADTGYRRYDVALRSPLYEKVRSIVEPMRFRSISDSIYASE